MSFLDRIKNIDRRIIFLLIGLGVTIPLLFDISFKEVPTTPTKKIFEKIDSMPPGSKVLFSFDYDPPSEPELQPMANSLIRHSATKGHKLFIMALWPMGQTMAGNTIKNILNKEFPDYRYGIDYINFGYKAGNQMVINVILSNFYQMFTQDAEKQMGLNNFEMMSNIKNLRNIDLIISLSAGDPGTKQWVQFGGDPSGVPIITGVTSVQAPLFIPYYPNQVLGILGGIKGAAEYEALIMEKIPRYKDRKMHTAIRRMGPQTIAHTVIILFVIIGNVTYFIDRARARKRSKNV